MRIAQVAPLYESVPPKLYGGTERVVSWLTEELVRQGHEVTLYASGGSKTSARLVRMSEHPLWHDPQCRDTLPHHVRLVERVRRDAAQFDLVHFHLDYVHFPVARCLPCPTLTTLHGRLYPPDEQAFFAAYPDVPLASISDNQRRPLPDANWRATVYHGLPRDLHAFGHGDGGYLAFLGRVSPEKGLDMAIEIARRAGMRLRVAAKIYPEERAYYEREIVPLFKQSPWVEYLGEVGGPAKDKFLGDAAALVFPITWEEPFGLVMIEAMACGTPVIAFRRGSVPEVLQDGVTGFVVDDVSQAADAALRVRQLCRRACRHAFEEHYDAARMARDYVAVYERLIASHRRARAALTGDAAPGRGEPAALGASPGPAAEVQGDATHVLAASSITDDRSRVLKHGDTFAVFDHLGQIKPGGLGEEGLYHEGTRYLSCLRLELDGQPPFFLGSTVRDENDQLSVTLTNPDEVRQGRVARPLGTLELAVQTFLWQGACHWRLTVKNHGHQLANASLDVTFAADFADIFEVRGMKRAARGRDLPAEESDGRVLLGYEGLDGERRQTLLHFAPAPATLSSDCARFELSLGPGEEAVVELTAACWRGVNRPQPERFAIAREAADGTLRQSTADACRVRAADGRFDAWLRRAESDLHMMTTELPTGPYPYAGVPWFNTPFGRDGIVTALECLWLRPELARGVLAYLADNQATAVVPQQDAEPGKILHETRNGEMAVLGEMPFARNYGSVDATPLFVLLAGAYFERTDDRAFVESIWPNVESALDWIDRYGDRDRDGFVEYERRSAAGLLHQGWKDSDEAVFHADGTPADGPIALCEVQAYVYAARRAAAPLARALGKRGYADELLHRADELRVRFESHFWCDDLGTYALALDGDKRPCQVRASNAGQCLFSGIAAPERAQRVAQGLMQPESFTGWGVRTLAAGGPRYNPMTYHNGTVWPHDNALIAWGFSRCGLQPLAAQLTAALFEAGNYFDLNRMPELFCRFTRKPGEGPVPYPVACSPQAWAAGSVFLLLQSCLGLCVNGRDGEIRFDRPHLPACVPELRIENLRLPGGEFDLRLVRHADGVGVTVDRRRGAVNVVVTS